MHVDLQRGKACGIAWAVPVAVIPTREDLGRNLELRGESEELRIVVSLEIFHSRVPKCQSQRDILSKLPPRARRHRWKNSTLTPFPNDDPCFVCVPIPSNQTESERHPKAVQYRWVTKSHQHQKKSIVTIVSILLDALIKNPFGKLVYVRTSKDARCQPKYHQQ